MRNNPNQYRLAIHEAGHAVIARVLMLACGRATIKGVRIGTGRNLFIGNGRNTIHLPDDCLHEWERRGHVRNNAKTVWHARIITFMAGVEAVCEIVGAEAIYQGDGHDRSQIYLMLRELMRSDPLQAALVDFGPPHEGKQSFDPPYLDRLNTRLRKMTRMLVRRHRGRIECVAAELVKRKTLTGPELDQLVGRSIENVRISAPHLKLAHRESWTEGDASI
jgi:hypothetical protein